MAELAQRSSPDPFTTEPVSPSSASKPDSTAGSKWAWVHECEPYGLDGFAHWRADDQVRSEAYESIQSNVIGCMSPGKCVKDDQWIQGLCYMEDEHELFIPDKPVRSSRRSARKRLPGRSRPKEVRKHCNVHGCTTLMKGRVAVPDKYGPDGVRCVKHGGGRRCNVYTCNHYAQCTVDHADDLGEPGGRCRIHSRLQREAGVRHQNRVASPPFPVPESSFPSWSMFPGMSPSCDAFPIVFASPGLASPLGFPSPMCPKYTDANHEPPPSQGGDSESNPLASIAPDNCPGPELLDSHADNPSEIHARDDSPRFPHYPGSSVSAGSTSHPELLSPSTSTCTSRYYWQHAERRFSSRGKAKRRRRATQNVGCGVPSCKREPRKLDSAILGPIYCAFHTPCCVPGCRTPGRGVVLEPDQFGAAGRRCRRHGAGSRCAVPQCLTLAREHAHTADKYGASGVRCLRHFCGVPSRSARCNVPGCATSDEGRVLVEDEFGPAGLRCKKHGGAKRCNVEECACNAKGKVDVADDLGPIGYRCKKHGGGPRCNVFGCGLPSKGRVYVHDTLGAVGFRCAEHGGSSRSCNIICV